MRTDINDNPTAFTTDVAKAAGLVYGVDYVNGDPFNTGATVLYTAKLLKDPVATTIRLIDSIGFVTRNGNLRWIYIAIPKFIWDSLDADAKRDVVGWMYQREGGVGMRSLFPNYGKL